MLTWLDNESLASAAAGHHPERLRSCGKALEGVRIAIMGDEGLLVERNNPGEIVARSRGLATEYYKSPGVMEELRFDGWHHTGDIGYVDDDGFVYIVDRRSDMILVGGINVYPAELEKTLMEIPEVYECAVVGEPDDVWGEVVKAIVVLSRGSSKSAEAIIGHCRTVLGASKSPRSVEFWDEIPHTPTGKPDKKLIRGRLRKSGDR